MHARLSAAPFTMLRSTRFVRALACNAYRRCPQAAAARCSVSNSLSTNLHRRVFSLLQSTPVHDQSQDESHDDFKPKIKAATKSDGGISSPEAAVAAIAKVHTAALIMWPLTLTLCHVPGCVQQPHCIVHERYTTAADVWVLPASRTRSASAWYARWHCSRGHSLTAFLMAIAGVNFGSVNVLANEHIRQGIKQYRCASVLAWRLSTSEPSLCAVQ